MHKTPDRIALVCGNKFITYKNLNTLANQLAYWLKLKLKILPGDLLAIQLKRSEWISITILGILKAGAAYVPIDGSLPIERRKFMIRDSG